MKERTYSIAFTFRLENSSLIIPLTADVEVHHSDIFYVVKNFRTQSHQKRSILPDVRIKKVNGTWVHCDSGKETAISMEVGAAIDRYEAGHADD
jgi:hypothetical protein